MPQSIFLVGPQCAGKTTLLHALETHFSSDGRCHEENHLQWTRPAIIHEVIRTVMRDSQISSKHFGTEEWQTLQMMAVNAQCLAEEAQGNRWYISDRSGLDPVIYAELGGGSAEQVLRSSAWEACRERMRRGLVLLCEAGNTAWLSADNVRLQHSMEDWTAMNDKYRQQLDNQGIAYRILPAEMTDISARVRFVLEQLEAAPGALA